MIRRIPASHVRSPRLVEIARDYPAANDADCRAMERRAVAWTFALCVLLAAVIVLRRFA